MDQPDVTQPDVALASRLLYDTLDTQPISLVRKYVIDYEGHPALNMLHLDDLTDLIQSFVASFVAMMIDAGSERDAIMESEGLREGIRDELMRWAA